jgi:dephospho-CoA kinase
MSFIVGLTGGIGSGKSSVAALFAELGVPVVDTDVISHGLTQSGGAAIPLIQAAFGDTLIDACGALDRAKMRQLVFSDTAARKRLENILHPLILAEAKAQAQASTAPYVLVVIPLLFETAAYHGWLQRTLTVDCAEDTQLARVTRRSGLDEQTVRAIMSQQLPRNLRLKAADDVINNEGDLAELRRLVSALNQRYLKLAHGSI